MRHTLHDVSYIHLPLLMLMLLSIPSCPQNEVNRRPVNYLIPDGYVGWIKVSFQVPNAPELPIEDGQYLARISDTGDLKTSSHIEYGRGKDRYYYYSGKDQRALRVTGWGGGGMVWGDFNGQELNDNHKVVQTYLQFFVGTEDEYRKHPTPPNPTQTRPAQQ